MRVRHSTFIVLLLLASCSDKSAPSSAAPATQAGTMSAAIAGSSAAGSTGTSGAGTSAAGTNAAGTAAAGMSAAAGTGVAGTTAAGTSAAGTGTAGTSAASTGDAGTSSSALPPTFATVKLVFGGGGGIMTCAAAPCHGLNGMAPPGKPLELPTNDDQKLYTNLTTYVSKACNDTKLVTPGKPDQSALLTILKGPCGMTPRMPYGCTTEAGDCIPDEYIEAVKQWIASGAPR
jgi:hypothetical protein